MVNLNSLARLLSLNPFGNTTNPALASLAKNILGTDEAFHRFNNITVSRVRCSKAGFDGVSIMEIRTSPNKGRRRVRALFSIIVTSLIG